MDSDERIYFRRLGSILLETVVAQCLQQTGTMKALKRRVSLCNVSNTGGITRVHKILEPGCGGEATPLLYVINKKEIFNNHHRLLSVLFKRGGFSDSELNSIFYHSKTRNLRQYTTMQTNLTWK